MYSNFMKLYILLNQKSSGDIVIFIDHYIEDFFRFIFNQEEIFKLLTFWWKIFVSYLQELNLKHIYIVFS